MLEVKQLTRSFIYKDKKGDQKAELPDPNPNYSLEQVLDHYSMTYPELSNAVIVRSRKSTDEKAIYELKTVFETKG